MSYHLLAVSKRDVAVFSLFLVVLLLAGLVKADYCSDNETLVHEITFTVNATQTNFSYTEPCVYGCDNETFECDPSPTALNIGIIVGIFGFMILVGLIMKFWGKI